MWPFAVAVLGGKYLTASFSVMLGHPSRKPARIALSKVESGGLHNDWCANFTAFVLQVMECVKLIVSVTGSVVSGRGFFITPRGFPSSVFRVLNGSVHRSVAGSLYPVKIRLLL